MSFQPVVPLTGYVGWRFLERTLETQQSTFAASRPMTNATTYFANNIQKVHTAKDLVEDRRLLEVALGAYGLDEDIDNKYFVERILSDGTADDDALANRLSDPRYAEFSQAFGFGDGPISRTRLTGFADQIVGRFEKQQFQQAVGEQNGNLRLALNVSGGIDDVIAGSQSTTARWFAIMGNAPLRNVFEQALGLPSSLARIDLDQQLETFQSRAEAVFGTKDIADFADPAMQDKLIRLFLVRSQLDANGSLSGGASTALTLLRSAPSVIA